MNGNINDEVTIAVKCAVCGKVTERTIFKRYLFKYRSNRDGTYTRLAGSCSQCAAAPAPGKEKPVYVREEHGLFIATADGGLVSIGAQAEENTDEWLFAHYPEAQLASSQQAVSDEANKRLERHHPNLIKQQGEETDEAEGTRNQAHA